MGWSPVGRLGGDSLLLTGSIVSGDTGIGFSSQPGAEIMTIGAMWTLLFLLISSLCHDLRLLTSGSSRSVCTMPFSLSVFLSGFRPLRADLGSLSSKLWVLKRDKWKALSLISSFGKLGRTLENCLCGLQYIHQITK